MYGTKEGVAKEGLEVGADAVISFEPVPPAHPRLHHLPCGGTKGLPLPAWLRVREAAAVVAESRSQRLSRGRRRRRG